MQSTLSTVASAIHRNPEIYWELLRQPLLEIENCRTGISGIATPWLNGVVASRLSSRDVPKTVKTVHDYFKQNNAPFSWWVAAEDEPDNLAVELKKYNIECVGDFMGMSVCLDNLKTPHKPENFEVVRVSSRQTLAIFVDALVQCYHLSEEVGEPVTNLFWKGGIPSNTLHFLGKFNGSFVSACSIWIDNDGIASVFNVGTIPEARNHGYASYMIYDSLKRAQEMDCKFSVLASTPMGKNLYLNLGFDEHIKFHLYM